LLLLLLPLLSTNDFDAVLVAATDPTKVNVISWSVDEMNAQHVELGIGACIVP